MLYNYRDKGSRVQQQHRRQGVAHHRPLILSFVAAVPEKILCTGINRYIVLDKERQKGRGGGGGDSDRDRKRQIETDRQTFRDRQTKPNQAKPNPKQKKTKEKKRKENKNKTKTKAKPKTKTKQKQNKESRLKNMLENKKNKNRLCLLTLRDATNGFPDPGIRFSGTKYYRCRGQVQHNASGEKEGGGRGGRGGGG